MEMFVFQGQDSTSLQAYLWQPEGEVKAVLQITHGMTEHMGRYEKFAEDMCRQGIAVAGFDLRGHGKNPGDAQVATFGEGGWAASIADMRLFFEVLRQKFPETPHYMYGFSLGSFLLREYLNQYPNGVAGAIIVGTGYQPGWLLNIMMGIVKGQIKKAGFDQTTELVKQLSFGAYNQKFTPNRTSADWLCADEAELDRYLADPLVRPNISAGLFWELLGSMKRTGNLAAYKNWHKEMPVMLEYGEHDPVGDAGKGVKKVYDHMKKAGMTNVVFTGCFDARHDLLHEEAGGAAEMLRHDVADFVEGR